MLHRPIAPLLRALLLAALAGMPPSPAAAWDAARAPRYPDADVRTLETRRLAIHGPGSTGDGSLFTVTLPDGTTAGLAQALAARQPLDPTLSRLAAVGPPLLRATGAGYQVQPDRTIRGPDGRRFVVRGVTFLDYLFVSLETRADYRFRAVPGVVVTGGGSSQSGFEPSVWGAPDGSDMRARIADWAAAGVNLLRVAVEPAVAYTGAVNGYPAHWDMLDLIVAEANRLGLVVQWQVANDRAPAELNAAFLGQLRDRYWRSRNVWINTGNEPGCSAGGPSCTDAATWTARQTQYLQAVRGDVTGQPAGSRFTGPVVLNAPNYGEAVDTVAATLANATAFATDPNLILGVHTYRIGEATFGARLPGLQRAWIDAIGTHALFLDEVGLTNDGSVRDPALDPRADPARYPAAPAATLATAYGWTADLLAWARRLSRETAFSGVTVFSGSAYIPGLGVHDPNSLRRRDGSWTPFGQTVRDGWLSASADATRFAGGPFVNLLYNADLALDTRGFPGGPAAAGTGTYDGWISLDGATRIGRAADGTVTLAGATCGRRSAGAAPRSPARPW